MITTVECPHCFTSMGVARDRICPACKINVREKSEADTTLCKVWIKNAQQLPDFCVVCDSPTTRRVAVKQFQKNAPIPENISDKTLLIITPIIGIINLLIPWSKGGHTKMIINIPQCEGCTNRKHFEPHRVVFDHLRMSFIVHKGFAQRISSNSSNANHQA